VLPAAVLQEVLMYCPGSRCNIGSHMHHEDALRMRGKAQRSGSPTIFLKDIETIKEWLHRCLGATKIHLACIIRLNKCVKPELEDGSLNYPQCVQELISQTPIRMTTSSYTI